MADVVHHEHDHESSSGLYVVLAIVVIALLGFLLWRYLPAGNAPTDNSDLNVNVDFPGGSSNTGGPAAQ